MKPHYIEYHLQVVEIDTKLKGHGFSDSDIRNILRILDTSLELFSSEKIIK